MSKTLKRKHSGGAKLEVKKQKIQNGSKKVQKKGHLVRGDAISWKEATLPDRLEDAEGFYGLEEVDDIEVLKDEETGLITFRTTATQSEAVDDQAKEDGTWSGFEDEDQRNLASNVANPGATDERKDAGSKPKAQKQAKSEKTAKKPKQNPTVTADIDDNIDFNALQTTEESTQVDVAEWEELGLSVDVLSTLSTLGFSVPTPIQKAAIPSIIDGRDVIGKAVTGSGKTLAFGIPILERWLEIKAETSSAQSAVPIAFILAPTRELAHQLAKHITALCKGLEQAPRIATVTGGLSVIKQQRQLETADIIIGTPGRLWEVINSSHGLIDRLKQVRFLVIDEADRLLSEGHFKEVEEILSILDRKVTNDEEDESEEVKPKVTSPIHPRQTLVFSATFHKGLQQKLATKQKWRPNAADSELLSNNQSLDYLLKKLRFQRGTKPTFVDANPTSQMAERLTESILECGAMQKDLYLYSLLMLQQHDHSKTQRVSTQASRVTRTLVFTNSISTVKRLAPLLQTLSIPSTQVLALHSSMPQKSRLRSLERFTAPQDPKTTTSVLISTDVAARGLDIKGIDTIIHYHVPRAADAYVHRSGRTARSTNAGRSILICSPDEVAGVTRLISKVHTNKSEDSEEMSAKKLKNAIQPLYLPANLPTQLSPRVQLAQRITSTTIDTTKSKSESSFLRTAAEELGVDYSSDDFESTQSRLKRGRGGGRDKKKRENVQNADKGKVNGWKVELKSELAERRIDFGDGEGVSGRGGRYLAGGAVDVERLLRERGGG